MGKTFTCLFIYLFLWLPARVVAQVNVRFQQWPAPKQLYARDAQNKAEVWVSGQLQSTAYSTASLLIYQNGQRWKALRSALTPGNQVASFQFNPTIDAGLKEYTFKLYAVGSKDSVLVASADSILCGDVYLLVGQSNITAFYPKDYSYSSKYIRSFGYVDFVEDTVWSVADTVWHLSNAHGSQVGVVGTELQRLILEKYGMPTCIINGGAGGSSIWSNRIRNADNPADLATIYGRMLYRAQKAGVADRVKAIIWRQGENEAGGSSTYQYDQAFKTLYENWQTDYKNVGKYYVAQINLLNESNNGAGWLRDFQRRIPELYPQTETIATVGLPTYTGIHYESPGHKQFAAELFRLIARDVYQSTDTTEISSPTIQRAFYRTPEQTEVVLEFNHAENMRWKQDTTITNPATGYQYSLDLRDFIYFDYANAPQERLISSGRAEGNRIILTLNKAVQAQDITYLPNFYLSNQLNYYNGPLLKNGRGMRALTFAKYPLASAIAPPANLVAKPVSATENALSWSPSGSAITAYVIERSDNTASSFRPIAQVTAQTTTYSDQSVSSNPVHYYYRVMALSQTAGSIYSNVAEIAPLILAASQNPDPSLTLYPIPTRSRLHCDLPLAYWNKEVQVSLVDLTGRMVLGQTVQVTQSFDLQVGALPAGTYVLRLGWKDKTVVRKIVIQ